MAYLDPYGGGTEPRARTRREDRRGRTRPDDPHGRSREDAPGWPAPNEPSDWERNDPGWPAADPRGYESAPGTDPRGYESAPAADPRGYESAPATDPRGYEPAGAPPAGRRARTGDDPRPRARRAAAGPDTFADRPAREPASRHQRGAGAPSAGPGYTQPAAPRGGPGHADPAGYDPDGYPPGGHDRDGYDREGYDRESYDRGGHRPEPGGYDDPGRNGHDPYPDGPYRGPAQPYRGPGDGPGDPYGGPEAPHHRPGPGYREPGNREPGYGEPGYGGSAGRRRGAGGPYDGADERPDDPREAYDAPHRPGDEPVRPPIDDVTVADAVAAPTDPVGWPLVDAPPPRRSAEVEEDPEPPSRRGPGRRRATRDRPPTQPTSTGRAGRNLPAAIGVGLGLGALVVVPLFLLRPVFLAVIAAAVAVGIWEMVRAVQRSEARPPLVPLVAGGLIMVGLAWFAGPDALSLGLLVTVLAAIVWRLGDGPAGFQRDLTAIALIAVYVPFLGGFAALLAVPPDGDLRVLVTLAAVVLSDTGGYAAGVAFGKHPMAPSVSPKKSWEGLGGSVLAAGLGSALLLWLLLDVPPWWGAVFGLAVSAAAVLGDLGESMIKRDLGVKDMSNLLPGHGGLMDRLDSVLFAVPTAYLLLAIFAPAG